MNFEEGAVFSGESAEGTEAFNHAGAVSPAAACATGEGDDGDGAGGESFFAEFAKLGVDVVRGVEDFVGRDVFDSDGGGKAVLREADLASAEFGLNAVVLDGIEAVLSEKGLQGFAAVVAVLSLRQETAEEGAGSILRAG